LVLLGDKAAAEKVLSQLAADYQRPSEFFRYADVLKTETDLGLRDLAFTHLEKMLELADKQDLLPSMFKPLFPERQAEALVWWKFLRKQHVEDRFIL